MTSKEAFQGKAASIEENKESAYLWVDGSSEAKRLSGIS